MSAVKWAGKRTNEVQAALELATRGAIEAHHGHGMGLRVLVIELP